MANADFNCIGEGGSGLMGLHDKVILRDSSKVAQNPSGMQHKIWPTRDCNRQRKRPKSQANI